LPARASRRRVPALTHDPSPLFQPPEVVGPYRVRRVLASGTLGPRLLVEDDRGRLQVLKLITDVADEADALAALLEQARQAVPPHAALLPVTEIGASDEGVYLASPVLNAPSVEGRLRDGRQTLDATLPWLRTLTDGLQTAHDAGVWHGALHPRDIMVTDEGGVLTGVGIAPALERLHLQAPVRVPFTAPERASGSAWDARADQYSLAMLALDALSGRRLIAGTIPAFDRWTLAETPTEDARLHDVFVRALHPDPDQRYPSLDAWFVALAGPDREEESGALSRFAREGVILASPAVNADPGREIKVQPLIDPEGVALSLFPEEDGTIESPVVDVAHQETQAAPAAQPDAEQEWLVADVPEEVPALETRAEPLTIQVVPAPALIHEDAGAPPRAPAWEFDSRDGETTQAEPARTWDSMGEESQGRRPWLIVVVMLVLVALAYGTWKSLQRATPLPTTTAAARQNAAESGSDAAVTPAPDPERAGPAMAPAETPAPGVVPQAPVQRDPVAPVRPPRQAVAPPVARAEPAPAPPPAPTGGRMLIRSSPSGEVRVNGIVRGETPVVLRELPFGRYSITVTRPGFATAERELTLLASQPAASLSVDLVPQGAAANPGAGAAIARPAPATAQEPSPTPSAPAVVAPAPAAAGTPPPPGAAAPTGGIIVMSMPGQARLFVDGQAYGNTPASVPGLSQGVHTIRVEAPGYRAWEGRVAVIAGTRVRVQATLQQVQE
jgi:serine/threonine protein kinase